MKMTSSVLLATVCVLSALAVTGCAHRAGDVQVRVASGAHTGPRAELGPHSFSVDRNGESPFGKREHERLCDRLEKEWVRQGWRLESENRAEYRIRCAWTDVDWQRVHRAPRVPMTRYWYMGSAYDPQGPSYALPGKTGMYRARQSKLVVELWHPAASAQQQPPGRSATLVQSGSEPAAESLARLVGALIEGGTGAAAGRR
jgi:hypothetical protein